MYRRRNVCVRKRFNFETIDSNTVLRKFRRKRYDPKTLQASPTEPLVSTFPISTRNAGFIASIEYLQIAKTLNLEEVESICTIHAFYRVHLWLMFYKMYIAQQQQSEQQSDEPFTPIEIKEEMLQQLSAVQQAPAPLAWLLRSIGKFTLRDGSISHAIFPIMQAVKGEEYYRYRSLYITPENIHQLVVDLSDPNTPDELRMHFIANNSIPGAQFVNNLLMNPDDIWPADYDDESLEDDLLHYNNLLIRAGFRLPPQFKTMINWSGLDTTTSLWSCFPGITMQGVFLTPPALQPGGCRRDAARAAVEVSPNSVRPVYIKDKFIEADKETISDYWCQRWGAVVGWFPRPEITDRNNNIIVYYKSPQL